MKRLVNGILLNRKILNKIYCLAFKVGHGNKRYSASSFGAVLGKQFPSP